ncbi:uncharacterized protein LOC143178862 isoform X2 [Calliopsis andreniformis]|uniref:uncharacterized protein LOC143178862 isoform X2 n=1 Tax=Calliopsis andreniformis TaxID=337506 RepID=UPI003FCCE007
MSQSRRSSVTIYDYPEHLNPFNEEITNNTQSTLHRDGKTKDSKHKFWTFGRSRKKRSNSFSIKSTWNGLFGKRKDEKAETQEKRSTITTVSSTYKREPSTKPVPPSRIMKDQQEFDEALGTLARRRKYTLDNSSRYSSSLTVNGDPARIYEGSPQDTTTSIMGDLTPKPPARRFGQVSPKPTDKIPPLDFENKGPKENGTVTLREKTQERTPIPPLRRFGNRSSQRMNANTQDSEEETNRSSDTAFCDENENVPDDYVFKRCTQDAVRKSNLSINSCVSVGSTMSAYGRKKRRAPQPPRLVDKLETSEIAQKASEAPSVELQIVEPTDIGRVTENIDEMTKKSKEEQPSEITENPVESNQNDTEILERTTIKDNLVGSVENTTHDVDKSCTEETCTKEYSVEREQSESKDSITENEEKLTKADCKEPTNENKEDIQIEYRRTSQENIEIIKDIDQVNSPEELEEVCLRRKSSSDTLSRSDSFSVKDEIEKIERQIKALESKNASRNSSEEKDMESLQANTRQSIQANRRHFFENMVENENNKVSPRKPVKVIELHISEPIRQKPEILKDVNPIPKPRRHSALNLNTSQSDVLNEEKKNYESARGKSF